MQVFGGAFVFCITAKHRIARRARKQAAPAARKLRLVFLFASLRLAKVYGPGEAWGLLWRSSVRSVILL